MKPADRIHGILAAGLCAALMLALCPGCASPAASNKQLYDRYAELVAERNRALQSGEAAAPAARAEPARPAAPAKPEAAKPAPAKPAPAKVEAAKPAPPKPAPVPPAPVPPKPAPVAAPAPEPPSPVQVVAPAPAAPVAAPPAPAPEPVAEPVPAPRPAASPAPDARPSSADSMAYLLKVGDVVQITLRGIPSGDAIEDVIDEDGMITLPLINEVLAAGTTPSELERSIRKIYQDQDIYRNITVTVVVPTRYYFIQGEIRNPGRFQIISATRVSQAIAGAGGYSEFASGRVVVKRAGRIIKNIRNARRLERTPEDDILLEPDDIVEVRRSLW